VARVYDRGIFRFLEYGNWADEEPKVRHRLHY
jgi:hypothetical protein